ncbi:MAG: hypothetical protein NC400_14450 [Clostridium sp.]|nr:hypothetical protein [Clostridium sp.]
MSLAKAQKAARKAIESGYTGVCTVIERRNVRDENSKITYQADVAVLENRPCKLSFEKTAATGQTDTAAAVAQGVKLFIAPEVEIKPGSKIVVEQNGRRGEYAASGQPAVYASHQEIVLEMFAGWA